MGDANPPQSRRVKIMPGFNIKTGPPIERNAIRRAFVSAFFFPFFEVFPQTSKLLAGQRPFKKKGSRPARIE